jgi:nitroreductase
MPSLDELLTERRSIRKYKAIPLPEAWIEQMLHLAAMAPSSGNSQPVRFVGINSPEKKSALREALAKGKQRLLQEAATSNKPKKLRNWINAYYRFSDFMFDVPLLLADGTVTALTGFSGTLTEAGLAVQDRRLKTDADIAVGLSLQGLLLKAQELGLGSCILTAPLIFVSDAEEILGLTDMEIKCFLTLGFPDEKPTAPKKKGLADIYNNI